MTRVHVYAPGGYYIGQVRKHGHRRWSTVTGKCRSGELAMSKAGAAMRGMKRARVLFITHCGYHEPLIVMECAR